MVHAFVRGVSICVCSNSLGGGRSARGIHDVRRFVGTNEAAADKYKCALKNGRKRENQKREKEKGRKRLKYQPKKEKKSNQPTLLQVKHSYSSPLFFIFPPTIGIGFDTLSLSTFPTTRTSVLFFSTSSIGPAVPPEPDARSECNESTLQIEVVAPTGDPDITAIFPFPFGLPPAAGLAAKVVYHTNASEYVRVRARIQWGTHGRECANGRDRAASIKAQTQP